MSEQEYTMAEELRNRNSLLFCNVSGPRPAGRSDARQWAQSLDGRAYNRGIREGGLITRQEDDQTEAYYPSLGWSAYPTFPKGRIMPTDTDWSDHLAKLEVAEPNSHETIRLAAELWTQVPPYRCSEKAEAVRDRCRIILGEYCRQTGIDTTYRRTIGRRYIEIPHCPPINEPPRQEIVEPLKSWHGDVRTHPGTKREIASRILASLPTEKPKGNNKSKPKRGRKQETDPKEDKRLCRDWNAAKGQGEKREGFTRNRGISINDLIAAQHREKYRRQRDAE